MDKSLDTAPNKSLDRIPNKSLYQTLKETHNIKFVSLILYTKLNDKIIFLLGKEAQSKHNKTDVNKISAFNGYLINDESIEQCVSRILFEKTMNLIIEPDIFESMIQNHIIPHHIDSKYNKIIFLYKFNFDQFAHVPTSYNKVYRYLTLCSSFDSMNNVIIPTCPVGFLDKSELNFYDLKMISESFDSFKKKFLYEIYLTFDTIVKTISN
jgi:hypothetical protein